MKYRKINSHFEIITTFGTFIVPNYGFTVLNDDAIAFILSKFLHVNIKLVNEAIKKSWDSETFEKNKILWRM